MKDVPELLAVLVGKGCHGVTEVPFIHSLVLHRKGVCSHHPLQSMLVRSLLQQSKYTLCLLHTPAPEQLHAQQSQLCAQYTFSCAVAVV